MSRFAVARGCDRVLELGAGCGVVSIAIAGLARVREVVALELQPELAQMAATSAKLNQMGNVAIICADLRTRKIGGLQPGSFDMVVMNPPYRAAGGGRACSDSSRRLARHEIEAALADFVVSAARYVRYGGAVVTIFAASRSAELINLLRINRLEPKRIRMVHPRIDRPASSILVEARKGAGIEVRIDPPLVIHTCDGGYTDEARSMLGQRC